MIPVIPLLLFVNFDLLGEDKLPEKLSISALWLETDQYCAILETYCLCASVRYSGNTKSSSSSSWLLLLSLKLIKSPWSSLLSSFDLGGKGGSGNTFKKLFVGFFEFNNDDDPSLLSSLWFAIVLSLLLLFPMSSLKFNMFRMTKLCKT